MDEFAAETKVEWRAWGPEAFDAADEAGKPVLLVLTVPWSAECREMDRRTYDEPRIAANVNDSFVPVRVDADRRPLVRDRYNVGGFPSTVFLTADGGVIRGATYLGPDEFRGMLDSVRESWDTKEGVTGSVPRSAKSGLPPAGEVTPQIESHVIEQLLATFDEEFGGWGSDVKFPMARTVEFALIRDRAQATRTLDALRTHLRDTDDGGFYRYAPNRDWSEARSEKLLDENAAIVRAFSHAYRYTGEEGYRAAAEEAIGYLTTTLWTGDAFAGSQANDTTEATLTRTERERGDAPYVDETVFAGRNGIAIDALCTFAAYTDDERARRFAARSRDHVVATLVADDGAVTHHRTSDEAGETGLLFDQAHVLGGLTSSWQVLGEGGPAEAVADWTIEHLRDGSGAFRDGPTAGAGLLSRPRYPLDASVELADALLDLAALADEPRYLKVAHDVIASFAGATDRMGIEVASFASVAARTLDPTTIAVGSPAGSDLHRAALRLADHESVVVPDAPGLDGVAEFRVKGRDAETANEIAGTAETPDDLEALLTGR